MTNLATDGDCIFEMPSFALFAPALFKWLATNVTYLHIQQHVQLVVLITNEQILYTRFNPSTTSKCNTHTHTQIVLLLFRNLSGTTHVSRYQKGKTRKGNTNLDLLEQEIVSGSDICCAICKSAPHPRQPRQHPTTQFLKARCPSCRPTNSVKALKAWLVSARFISTVSQ